MNAKIASKNRYEPPAVRRAIEVLELIADTSGEAGITEIAAKLGLSKSTVHGLTGALEQAGALYKNPDTKKYSLGAAILDMAFRNWNYIRIGDQAQPFLDDLRDRIGETVFWGVMSQASAVILTRAESHNPLKISSPAGTSIPLLAGAVGKVFLALAGEEEALRIIRQQGLPRFTARSIVDEKRYLQELVRVRRQGYAFDNEEYLPGIRAVAVALGNRRGLPLALWVVGFAGSFHDEKLTMIIKETMDTADKLRTLSGSGLR